MRRFSRRVFLRRAGVAWGLGTFSPLAVSWQARAQSARSRVVSITDGRAGPGPGWGDADLDRDVLRGVIGHALEELTGLPDPRSALVALLPGLVASARRVGVKVNCVNPALPSHPRVVAALCDLLLAAGASGVTIFDRSDTELAEAGFNESALSDVSVTASNQPDVGFADGTLPLTDGSVRLSRALLDVDHLISLPVLKNHEMAGVTLSLKNHFGSIDRPSVLHGRDRECSPGIAELNSQPEIRDRTRLVIIDATFATFRSGLAGEPDAAPMTIIASRDPVAADAVGQARINALRAAAGLAPVKAQHIRDAAALGLGTADLTLIERIDRTLAPVGPRSGLDDTTPDPGCGCRAIRGHTDR